MNRYIVSKLFNWIICSCTLLTASTVCVAVDIRTENVQFKKGTNSAVIEASIKGYEIVDYVLGAKAGQYMNVSLATKHGATYFNVLAPGENELAIFNGSAAQNQFEGTLAASGNYKIRVYMMRSAARRNETAMYRLEMIIDGAEQPIAPTTNRDVVVPGTAFHATGKVSCAMAKSQTADWCSFGVKRKDDGSASVTVTKLNGEQRVIIFESSGAISYDRSKTDAGELKFTKQADLNLIHIGEELYKIPDAVIHGG